MLFSACYSRDRLPRHLICKVLSGWISKHGQFRLWIQTNYFVLGLLLDILPVGLACRIGDAILSCFLIIKCLQLLELWLVNAKR